MNNGLRQEAFAAFGDHDSMASLVSGCGKMDPENWQQAKGLLDQVLKIEPAGRASFLKNAGVADDIRAEVESLLSFDDPSQSFMSLSLAEFSKDLVAGDEPESSLAGQKIGIYEITGELGFGGMGAVYLAERADGKFKQKVALKMLKREFNVGKLRETFDRERAILSKLEHPNIARLLDAGTTEDGVPYLAMEYVEGVPVDEFCKVEDLSVNSRLKLFNKICDAVQFAHRNLVIHRDLKPSNILVTKDGEPKLLDFGISKLLDSEDKTLVTAFGAMTPEYASPEQIRGETVSTASDIYSLGVVLYKILTDSLPYDRKGKTTGELLRTIAEDKPTAPSAVSGRGSEMEHDVGSKPRAALRRSIAGDLDNIILKALSKEPARRYQTVEQFSGDVWRHLDRLPILARPATLTYRAGKFIKRNKIAVIAGSFIALSLVAGIAVALWQARKAQEQARISAIETQKAKEEQLKAEKITRFVSKVFGYANPGWFAEGAKGQGQARVIEVVEELSDEIDTEFADEADVAAELHSKFSEIFLWVAKSSPPAVRDKYLQRSKFHAFRALALRRQFYGDHNELVARDLSAVFGFVGNTDAEHAAVLIQAIQMMRETNPRDLNFPYMFEAYVGRLMLPGSESSHEAYRNAVLPPTDENKYQIGERMLREALPVWALYYPPDHPVILSKNCWLAYALGKQGKWAEFDEPYRICKQSEVKVSDEQFSASRLKDLEMVEAVLKERKQ